MYSYKKVLVVGATSGIGLALAERMIENGVFVILTGRRRDKLHQLANHHGPQKVAVSPVDITDLKSIRTWLEGILRDHPDIDAVLLNAGIQRGIDFTKPASLNLDMVNQEMTTNYTSYVHLIAQIIPHLQSLNPRPAAIMIVTSGLALVPIPRCANYCASKAALHSLCWSLRWQLGHDDQSNHIKVFEIVPPAVQTELHMQQADLVSSGMDRLGMPLVEFTNEAWRLLSAQQEEILVGPVVQKFGEMETGKKNAFEELAMAFARQVSGAP